MIDKVSAAAARARGRPTDRKLAEYLDSIRDVERRIQKAEAQNALELPASSSRSGRSRASFEDYAKLMFDLQVLAYQADLTAHITFMVGKELSARSYPEIGVPDAHHRVVAPPGSDAGEAGAAGQDQRLSRDLFAYFLEKLRATPDGDGSPARVAVIYGSGMSNSNHLTSL